MVAFLLLLSGCANALPRVTYEPPRDEDAAVIFAALDAWNSQGDLPLVAPADVRELLVTDAEDADIFRDLCRTGLVLGACATTRDHTSGPLGMFTPSSAWKLIVLSPGQRSRPARGCDRARSRALAWLFRRHRPRSCARGSASVVQRHVRQRERRRGHGAVGAGAGSLTGRSCGKSFTCRA